MKLILEWIKSWIKKIKFDQLKKCIQVTEQWFYQLILEKSEVAHLKKIYLNQSCYERLTKFK